MSHEDIFGKDDARKGPAASGFGTLTYLDSTF
jgi:hypothetical protein